MKKLTLLAAVAAVALTPALASAGNYKSRSTTWNDGKTYHETHDGNHAADFKVRVNSSEQIKTPAKPQTLDLANGGRILVEGDAIFALSDNGFKSFAPNGPYETTRGITYYAEDGLVLRAENPQEMVYVDTDLRDRDRDGYSDDVDVNVETRRIR